MHRDFDLDESRNIVMSDSFFKSNLRFVYKIGAMHIFYSYVFDSSYRCVRALEQNISQDIILNNYKVELYCNLLT